MGALRDAPPADAVVLDCLTLLTSSLLLRRVDPDAVRRECVHAAETDVTAAVDGLLTWQRERHAPLYVVSNELGHGVVAPTALGQASQGVLGGANQRLTAAEVMLVVAGLALPLKTLRALPISAPLSDDGD